MVYQDYDEEDLDFDNAAPVAVGQVGVAKARASTRLWHRRVGCGCCGCAGAGIPVICVVAVLLVAAIVSVSIAAVVTVRTNSDKNDDHSSSSMAPTTSPTSTSSSAAWYDTWDKSLQWLQKGNDIGGIDSAPGNYGISVGMAGDGHMWAEGAHQAIGTDATSGHVRVFRYKAATEQWERFGKELLGDKHGDEYGYSLDLSRDGTHVAVGAPGADRAASGPDHGYFNVHRWNDTAQEWVQMGPDKWGEAANERSGHDIQINTRGNLVAIGAPGSPIEGPDTGEIRLFEYMPNTDRWLRRGNDIHGEAAGDRFGWSVAMNDDATDDSGLMIAGGAPYADANGADAGEVRVFMYNHTQHGRFHKVGHTMRGKAPGDNFGWSVAMNGEGTIVAVGAPGGSYNGMPRVGYVEVFEYQPAIDAWHKIGYRIYGRFEYEGFGKSVELSLNGQTLIVGAPDKNESTGAIRVFKYNREINEWLLAGHEIDGDGKDDYWGDEVAVSSDGKVILSGGMNLGGVEVGNAHARVYHTDW